MSLLVSALHRHKASKAKKCFVLVVVLSFLKRRRRGGGWGAQIHINYSNKVSHLSQGQPERESNHRPMAHESSP